MAANQSQVILVAIFTPKVQNPVKHKYHKLFYNSFISKQLNN